MRRAKYLDLPRPAYRKIAEAASRYRNLTDYLNSPIWRIPARILFWLALIIAINLDPYRAKKGIITPSGLALLVGFLVALFALPIAENNRFPLTARTLRSRVTLIILALVTLLAVWNSVPDIAHQQIMPGLAGSPIETTLRSAGSFVLAVGAFSYTAGKSLLDQRLRARQCRPYDAAALRTLRLAAAMQRSRTEWHTRKTVRQWVIDLEDIATLATIDFTLPGRVSRADWETWKEFREEAVRIAGIFRAHKGQVLRARRSEDIDEVVESLKNGVMATLEGDRVRLLENAPEGIIERDPFITWLRRAISGGMLIFAGFLLPALPIVADHAAAAQSLRWTLFVAGAAMLISASPEVNSRVNDAFGKAIAGK
ncbi:hypothetical protein ACFRNJ_17265 [Streptomyces sp. NPDC056721]|uniref:hypothetical protein n=1 Tax=Streptomyces sp. NPDC056721 TaxID=3345923 RepID=UPI0036747349